MTRVLLIYPYSRPKHDRSIFRFPPLGIGYIAATLRDAGYDVRLLDCTFLTRREALEKAQLSNANIVGVYSMVSMKEDSLWFAGELRKKGCLLVAGGPLPTCDPLSFIQDFDIVVRGEGEQAMTEIVRAFNGGIDLQAIPGIVYRQRDPVFTPERGLEKDINKIPFPARELFPNQDYVSHWKRKFGRATTTVFTTRGCPFSCEFCSNAVFGVSYRERSPENVVDEVEEALSFGYNHIHFADDVFTLNKERVIRICQEIRLRKLNFSWECLGRADSVDGEVAAAMKGAGCTRIFFGIESGNDSVLKLMNKKITVEKARLAIHAAKNAGISVGAFFILCYPGETNSSVLNTIRFATSLPLDYLSFTVPYPLPGTLLYERVKGKIIKEWKQPDGFLSDHILTFQSEFSEAKMRLGILKGQVQFWFRKNLGRAGVPLLWPFEKLTDKVFRIMK
jgi:anaerobic magnesium-protoporphyrin IX monomethyl ester cyclase